MKAKKYFERLGYKYEKRDNEILYSLDNGNYIIFFEDDKIICTDGENNVQGIEMDMEELKATIKQCKELGWLDER